MSKRSWTWLILLVIALVAIIAFLMLGRKRFRARIHRRIRQQHEQQTAKKAATELDEITAKLKPAAPEDIRTAIGSLVSDKDWTVFREKFSTAYPKFFPNLDKALGKRATTAYEKVASLIYLGLDNKQIGNAICISKDSVARTKRRLREALGCENQDLLKDLISKL